MSVIYPHLNPKAEPKHKLTKNISSKCIVNTRYRKQLDIFEVFIKNDTTPYDLNDIRTFTYKITTHINTISSYHKKVLNR